MNHQHDAKLHLFSPDEISDLRASLLTWFDKHRRLLPWRGDCTPYSSTGNPGPILVRDPYVVWVSEIMLQQTRVDTVIPYFESWMTRFPTIASLASASLEDVNEAWAGIGYYRRAKYLLDGAKFVMKFFSGSLPENAQDLKCIPGIGDYTAGAIASIAFKKTAAAVDGNVIRVFSRLRAIAAPANSSKALKLHWELAIKAVDDQRPGDFNQALMELGATLCTHSNPQCDICPVQRLCSAYRECNGQLTIAPDIEDCCQVCLEDDDSGVPVFGVTRYPRPKIKAKPRKETTKVLCLESNQGLLLIKRSDKGLLAGQWEFPCWERHEAQLTRALSASKEKPRTVRSITHIFSHINMTINIEYVFMPEIPKRAFLGTKTRIVPRASFEISPLTTGVQKVFKTIQYISKSF